MDSKSTLRRRIFRHRLRKVDSRKLETTPQCIRLDIKSLIPADIIEILAIYFDEVCELNSKQLQAEAKRYTSGRT